MRLPDPILRRLGHATERLTLVRPRLGLAAAARLGRLAASGPSCWRMPTTAELEAFLGPLGDAELRRIRREVAAQEFRNAALRRLLMARGVGAITSLVATVHAEPLLRERKAGTPLVVLGAHLGPSWGRSAALWRVGVAALSGAVRGELPPDAETSPVRQRRTLGDGSSTAFLKEALMELESGGVVTLQLDGGPGVPTDFLGGRLRVARGAAWLVRRTGARLLPATGRFAGPWQIEWTFHEPLPEPDLPREPAAAFEAAVTAGAVSFFESFVRAHPERLRVPPLRRALARRT